MFLKVHGKSERSFQLHGYGCVHGLLQPLEALPLSIDSVLAEPASKLELGELKSAELECWWADPKSVPGELGNSLAA